MAQSGKPNTSLVPESNRSSQVSNTSRPTSRGGNERAAEQILANGATDILLERVSTWKHEEAVHLSTQLSNTGRSALVGTFNGWVDDCNQQEPGDKQVYAQQISREFAADLTDVVGKIVVGGARINAEIAAEPISYDRETQKKGFWDKLF